MLVLLGALALVVFGSLFGEWAGINNLLGNLWFWFGHQGSEYLDLGRFWQLLLAVGLIFWLFLMFRALRPAMKGTEQGELPSLFLYAAVAIPLFYVPALFYGPHTNFAVIDNLAVLDHSPLGGRILRTLRDGAGGGDVLPAGPRLG